MKKLLVVLVAAAALLAPAAASAHPLGNFTINRFARVEVAGHRLYVRYVLDLAEIPTYQARQDGVDPAVYARRIARGLHVTVDGRAVRAAARRARARVPARRRRPAHDAARGDPARPARRRRRARSSVRDTNYAGRIGWKEIVVGASTRSVSDELHAYPKSLLQSPLDVTRARATVAPTDAAVPQLSRGQVARGARPRRRQRLHAG